MKTFFSSIVCSFFLFSLLSCNVYAPLNSNNSDLDKLEEAQKCLKDSDYACAISQYKNLSDPTLKNQKLCQAYLSKGGVTLSVLVKEINNSSTKMLSGLARALTPWDAQKSEDLDNAKTYCTAYFGDSSSQKMGLLLNTISLFSHCAIRVAKANLFQATHDTGPCNQTLSTDNSLTATDIALTSDGTVGTNSPGMCPKDVQDCGDDLVSVALSESDLSSLGFDNIANAINGLKSLNNNNPLPTVPSPMTDTYTDKIRQIIWKTF
jgi:hypothetical protein